MTSAAGDGIRPLTEVDKRVQDFYQANPFPAFDPDKYHSREDLRQRASPYSRLLDEQLPHHAQIADIGCGTGQLACFLALRGGRHVLAVDFSPVSLGYARALKDRLGLDNLEVIQGSVLGLPLASNIHDYVFCNGVLHHTSDPTRGFTELVRITRPGGYLTVGLYNTYGRTVHRVIRQMSLRTGPLGPAITDWGLRHMLGQQFEERDRDKARTWWADQFVHPHESVHTANEVLRWFDELDVDYVASAPPIELGASETRVNMFPRRAASRSPVRHATAFIRQLEWVWQLRWTGGYFAMVGRKRNDAAKANSPADRGAA